jgi:hypothetical protein
MLNEEYLWRRERAREQRRLERLLSWVRPEREPPPFERLDESGPCRLRRRRISSTGESVRIVLKADGALSFTTGRRGALVSCRAGHVEVRRGNDPRGRWHTLKQGAHLTLAARRRVMIRAVSLSTVEFGGR